MFKLQPEPTFTAAVALSIPGQDKPGKIDITFRHMGREKLRDFFNGMTEGDTSEVDALSQMIIGWSGVDVPYSPESLASLLDNYPSASGELFAAYQRELFEGRRKN